jgi:hypothetical protein
MHLPMQQNSKTDIMHKYNSIVVLVLKCFGLETPESVFFFVFFKLILFSFFYSISSESLDT